MTVAVRKVQIEDAAKLQMLVAENIDSIEPGLVVLDSRLLLGHATIDVVAVDTNGALVLIATGLTANEEMLLKAVEAYSWCREYPQSLERLYPSCVISDERPPRLVFVVERIPDAFHRKIKQLGFPEVDCVEFRLLDIEGVPAVYFESILRMRRPSVTAVAAPRSEPPADVPMAPAPENVIAMNGPAAARATTVKLQKLMSQAATETAPSVPRAATRPVAAPREPASIVSMVNRQAAAAAAPSVVRRPEPVAVPAPVIVTPEPVIATPERVTVAPEPVIVTPDPVTVAEPVAAVPDADLLAQMQRALAALEHKSPASHPEPQLIAEPPRALVAEAEPVLALEPTLELVAEPEVVRAAVEPQPAEPRVSFKDLAAALLGSIQAPVAPAAPVVEPVVIEPVAELRVEAPAPSALDELVAAAAAEVTADVVAAPKPVSPAVEAGAEVEPALTVEALIAAPAAPAEPAKQADGELPLQFAGLKFPNNGQLTRQWMEFLSQMSASK